MAATPALLTPPGWWVAFHTGHVRSHGTEVFLLFSFARDVLRAPNQAAGWCRLLHWVLGFCTQSSFCKMLKPSLRPQTAAGCGQERAARRVACGLSGRRCGGTRSGSVFRSGSGSRVDQICSRLRAQTPPGSCLCPGPAGSPST